MRKCLFISIMLKNIIRRGIIINTIMVRRSHTTTKIKNNQLNKLTKRNKCWLRLSKSSCRWSMLFLRHKWLKPFHLKSSRVVLINLFRTKSKHQVLNWVITCSRAASISTFLKNKKLKIRRNKTLRMMIKTLESRAKPQT